MGLHKWSLLWSLVVCQTMSISAAELTVGINESSCEHKTDVLFCDYKNSNQDTVKMNPISDDKLKKVFLYNINKLILSEAVCVSVALHNVKEVVIQKEENAKCSNTVELSAKKCKLDSISGQITALYLEESELKSLETNAAFSKFSVISSVINTLNLTASLANGTKAVIQDSKVWTLNKMVIDNGASLLIMKSTINTTNENSLEIKNGDVTVKDSTFKTTKGSVNLGPKSSLTVANQQVDMTVTGWPINIEQPPKTGHSGSYLVPFVILLIFFLISLIVIALMAYYCKDALMELHQKGKNKSTQDKPKNDEEKGLLDNNRVCQHAEKAHKDIAKIKEQTKLLIETYKKEEKAIISQVEELTNQLDNQASANVANTDKQKSKNKQKEDNSKILEQITNKIAHLHKKLACSYRFLGVLQEKEVAVVGVLTQDFFNYSDAAKKKLDNSIAKCNYSEEVSTYEMRFNSHEKELKNILDLLTSPHEEDAYKKQFNLSDEMIKNFKELSEKLGKDSSKKHNAIAYCAKKIEEIDLTFKASLLEDINKELEKRMERTEELFKYLTENPALHGKEQEDPQATQIEPSVRNENETLVHLNRVENENTPQEYNQVHT